ncbi:MAG: class I SAM-dependent methyltransferase [Pseudomonadota bacterium]
MTGKHREQWEQLGETDPYWAVLTNREKRGGKWERDEFFATGEKEITGLMNRLDSLGISVERQTVLDFGCGVGRLARALASRFNEVLAVDISAAMLEEARKANSDKPNIRFIHNTLSSLEDIEDDHVDLVYSSIVLQHIPTVLQQRYLDEFVRVTKPGGMIVFQTPSAPNLRTWQGWVYRLLGTTNLNRIRRVVLGGSSGIMEMHCLSRPAIEAQIANHGAKLVQADIDESAGVTFLGYRYYVRVMQ